jgi:hypothetical protein
MTTYTRTHNPGFAAVLLAALAVVVSNGLAASQQAAYEREVLGADTAVVLPEIVVTARRLET